MNRADYAAAAAQPRNETMYDSPTCAAGRLTTGIAAGVGAQSLKTDSPPLFQTMDLLVSAQNAVHDRLEALVVRLDPLLGIDTPSPTGTQVARAGASPFDETLQFRVDAEWRVAARIEELLRRLSI